ncbi:MAG TPA: allene oxide cyclase family protein [Thermoanaerobaculia bacterium]|nr:allene oxide cyclase family protein [Thermoanaerobaculia bacterium]
MAMLRAAALLPFAFAYATSACLAEAPPPNVERTPAVAPKTQTIALVERATSDAVSDLGAKGDSIGDLLTFANEIFDAKNEKKVGSDQGYCLRTVAGKAWECNWTLTLADGQITVEGPFFDTSDSVLAVTGGTGAYSGAKGQMKLHARNEKQTEYDFAYELVW